MKHRIPKIFLVLLAFVLVASACAPTPAEEPAAPAEPAEEAEPVEPVAEEEKIVVAVQVLTTEIEYFEQLRQAYIKAAEANGFEITTSDAQNDVQNQVNFIEDSVAKGVTAIVLSLVDAAAAQAPIEDAISKGIPVIVQGQEVEDFPYGTANVGYSEESMGKHAGDLVAQCLNEKFPDVEVFNGVSCQWPDWPSTVRRDKAAMDAVEEGVAPKQVNWVLMQKCGTRDWGLEVVSAALVKEEDLHFVVGVNDGSSIGAVAAYESANVDPIQVCIAGPNNDAEVRPLVAEGKVYGTVDLNHQGLADLAMTVVGKLARGEAVDKMNYVEMVPVTIENIGNWYP